MELTASRFTRLLLVAASLALALLPGSALAADPRGGESVVIGPNETINDDLYAFGNNVDIRGTVNGDVIASGASVNVSGTIAGDLIAAGGTLNVTGEVQQTIRAAGGNIFISGSIGEDAVLAGGNLVLGSGGRVDRDLLATGGTASVEGEVGRNLLGGLGTLTVAAPVGGDIRVDTGDLRLTDQAVVTGDLVYGSDDSVDLAQGAQVGGTMIRSEPAPQASGPLPGTGNPAISWLRGLLGTFALGAFFVLMWPSFSQRASNTIGKSPWASLGIGFALFLVIPVLAILLFVVGLFAGGWWLGPLSIAAYALLIGLGLVVAGLFAGRWGLEVTSAARVHPVWALLLGLAVLLAVGLIPFAGWLIVGIAVLFGLGALAIALVEGRREPPAAVSLPERPIERAEAA